MLRHKENSPNVQIKQHQNAISFDSTWLMNLRHKNDNDNDDECDNGDDDNDDVHNDCDDDDCDFFTANSLINYDDGDNDDDDDDDGDDNNGQSPLTTPPHSLI